MTKMPDDPTLVELVLWQEEALVKSQKPGDTPWSVPIGDTVYNILQGIELMRRKEIGLSVSDEDGIEENILPEGWTVHKHPVWNGHFYYHRYTALVSSWFPTHVPLYHLTLPEGWKSYTSKTKNRIFYYHAATGITRWSHPRFAHEEVGMPQGWVIVVDSLISRQRYYFNILTGTTQCERPTTGTQLVDESSNYTIEMRRKARWYLLMRTAHVVDPWELVSSDSKDVSDEMFKKSTKSKNKTVDAHVDCPCPICSLEDYQCPSFKIKPLAPRWCHPPK